MKTLFITESIYYGGTDTFVNTLAKEFSDSGNSVHLLINKDHKNLNYYIKNKLFKTTDLFPWVSLNAYKNSYGYFYNFIKPFLGLWLLFVVPLWVGKLAKKRKINNIIIVNGGFPGGLLTYSLVNLVFFLRKTPIIYTIHNYPKYTFLLKLLSRFVETLNVKSSTIKFVTVSESCKKELLTKSNIKLPIQIINNGVIDLKPITNKKRRKHFNILFVGNIEKRKGIHLLIRSIQNIEKKIVSVRIILHIYGANTDNNYFAEIKNLSNNSKNIIFHGFNKSLNEIYDNKDLLVLPSISNESFGLVLIEAMMFGIPIIASKGLGMDDIYNVAKKQKIGTQFKVADHESLTNSLLEIIENKNIKELSKNARALFLKHFTSKIMYKNYSRVFKITNNCKEL